MSKVENSVYCKRADVLKYELEERVHRGDDGDFPHFLENAHKLFEAYEEFMEKNIHPVVEAGAAASGDGILTGHGARHVQTTINVAGRLIADMLAEFNGYEIYILLLSAHLHDVGNYYGRTGHEEKIREVVDLISVEALRDEPLKMLLLDIAGAHGGELPGGNKDKISKLLPKDSCNSMKVRPQLLAAILRFADELADDNTRTTVLPVLIKNEIFHRYSAVLSPVDLEGATATMKYYLSSEDVTTKYGKGRRKVLLYEEILERLEKCMKELEYCRLYSGGFIKITTLSVQINIMHASKPEPLVFRLTLSGYPSGKRLKDYFVDDDDFNKLQKKWRETNRTLNQKGV